MLEICCSSEVNLTKRILNSMDGVKDVSVVVLTKIVIALHDNTLTSQLQIGNFPERLILLQGLCILFLFLFT